VFSSPDVHVTPDTTCSNYTSPEDIPGKGSALFEAQCACGPYFDEVNGALIPYFRLYYCSETPALMITLLLLWSALVFVVLASTADDFLVPALTTLSDFLGLSPNMAGVGRHRKVCSGD
jgi:hypothetical protein